MGDYRPLADLNEDLRLLILACCGFTDALSLMRMTKAWYSSYQNSQVWKHIYSNTFADFKPKPVGRVDWLAEIKSKIQIYGTTFDDYKHLIGNVKIKWQMDPPIEVHEGAHIHKTLGLYIDDRLLPFMGYLGPNEVCYNDWIVCVFKEVLQKFDSNLHNEVRWDFCDQGMPEFVFEREGPICKLSIAEGICGGRADPEWQQIPFLIEDFRVEVIKFLEELHHELITKYGNFGKIYWEQLGVDMLKDGTFFGFSESNHRPDLTEDDWEEVDFDFDAMAKEISTSIKNKKQPLTLENVPKEKHVFFGSSDSDSSEGEKSDQSTSGNKKDKKHREKKQKKSSKSKKRKHAASNSSSSSEEKPKKKKKR